MIARRLDTITELKIRTGAKLAELLPNMGNLSEMALVENWHQSLKSEPDLFADGWYMPPPHGIISIFGKSEDRYSRVSIPSFRTQMAWPQSDVFFDPKDILVAYASPVQKKTGLIGDFGGCFYKGRSPEIRVYFESVLRTTLRICDAARVGMPFSELYKAGMDIVKKEGFNNDIESFTDQAGTNIGHTIPGSYISDPVYETLSRINDETQMRETLRTGRKFISSQEHQRIEDNMAFTIEPRLSTETMPQVFFHMTVIFKNGVMCIVHGLEAPFKAFNMDDIIPILPS